MDVLLDGCGLENLVFDFVLVVPEESVGLGILTVRFQIKVTSPDLLEGLGLQEPRVHVRTYLCQPILNGEGDHILEGPRVVVEGGVFHFAQEEFYVFVHLPLEAETHGTIPIQINDVWKLKVIPILLDSLIQLLHDIILVHQVVQRIFTPRQDIQRKQLNLALVYSFHVELRFLVH